MMKPDRLLRRSTPWIQHSPWPPLYVVRVQGVSPFLFTLRLVAFNFASYPALADAAQQACLDLLQRGWPFHPSLRNLVLPDSSYQRSAVRFCSRAGPLGPPASTGPLASWREDFPQCRTLSATLLLPQTATRDGRHQTFGLGCVIWRTFSERPLQAAPWTSIR